MSKWGPTVVFSPHKEKTGPSDRHECLPYSALPYPKRKRKQYTGIREEVMADHKPEGVEWYYYVMELHRILVLCQN